MFILHQKLGTYLEGFLNFDLCEIEDLGIYYLLSLRDLDL